MFYGTAMESEVSTLSPGEYMYPVKVTFVTVNIKISPVFALFADEVITADPLVSVMPLAPVWMRFPLRYQFPITVAFARGVPVWS